MHLPNFLPTLLLLFPLSVAAVASHDPAASAEINTNKLEAEPRAISRPQHCAIVGSSSTVNCRSGPGTKYDVRVKLARGRAYDFWCVYSKECVTIGGKRNWYACLFFILSFFFLFPPPFLPCSYPPSFPFPFFPTFFLLFLAFLLRLVFPPRSGIRFICLSVSGLNLYHFF